MESHPNDSAGPVELDAQTRAQFKDLLIELGYEAHYANIPGAIQGINRADGSWPKSVTLQLMQRADGVRSIDVRYVVGADDPFPEAISEVGAVADVEYTLDRLAQRLRVLVTSWR